MSPSRRPWTALLTVLAAIVGFTGGQRFLSVSCTNLTLNGQKVFLSGMNQAWWTYENDFNTDSYVVSRPHLIQTLEDIQSAGGNSIRVWLHTGGDHSPVFNSSGYVVGLDPNFVANLQDFVEQARQRNILVTFTLWNCGFFQKSSPLAGLLANPDKIQSYISHALVPMVRGLKSQRALGMWEIVNEPEGCVLPEVQDSDICYDTSSLHFYDFSDWTHGDIPLKSMLIFIAEQASAIHQEDPKALVTVGSWEYKSVTDQMGRRNFYSDKCLQHAAGGREGARLDLYQIHTYSVLDIYFPNDPFNVDAKIYKLDKPLVLGEFSQKKGGFRTSPEQYTWAYEHGYNGALAWSAKGSDSAADSVAVMQTGINSIRNKTDQSKGGQVKINLQDSLFYRILKGILGFMGITLF